MTTLVVDCNSEEYNKQIDEINASVDADVMLYKALAKRIDDSGFGEEKLMEWARFVKLAAEGDNGIMDLTATAVGKILRSWKSIVGIITLQGDEEKSLT